MPLAFWSRYAQLSAMTLLTSKAFRERVLQVVSSAPLCLQGLLNRFRLPGPRRDPHLCEGESMFCTSHKCPPKRDMPFADRQDVNLSALAQCYFILGEPEEARTWIRLGGCFECFHTHTQGGKDSEGASCEARQGPNHWMCCARPFLTCEIGACRGIEKAPTMKSVRCSGILTISIFDGDKPMAGRQKKRSTIPCGHSSVEI